jgi:hypothetical protein
MRQIGLSIRGADAIAGASLAGASPSTNGFNREERES